MALNRYSCKLVYRILLRGLAGRHPKTSLQIEMGDAPTEVGSRPKEDVLNSGTEL